MGNYQKQCRDYERVETAIRYIEAHHEAQPGLTEIARAAQMSDYHFQRLFSRWAGISPKRFVQFLSIEEAKRRMHETGDLLGLSHDVGLSGPGRRLGYLLLCTRDRQGEHRRDRGCCETSDIHCGYFLLSG